MGTEKQQLGERGEQHVARTVRCPGCKSDTRTFRLLPNNFKCADLVCDFCGYLAQVKTKSLKSLPNTCPPMFPGAAWEPQEARMKAGIYFSLYLVVEDEAGRMKIWFIPRDLQVPEMFSPRKPLKSTAKRAGWQGFTINAGKGIAPPVEVLG